MFTSISSKRTPFPIKGKSKYVIITNKGKFTSYSCFCAILTTARLQGVTCP